MSTVAPSARVAERIFVRGVVQGVGFRPFVFRLAGAYGLAGWVLNGPDGVEIHVEGQRASIRPFVEALETSAPPAARVASIAARAVACSGCATFEIRESAARPHPTVRITPDLAVCDACVRELRNPTDRRAGYPYVNCTNCGPRYSIVTELPYDRPRTTMRAWPMCEACAREYGDVSDRRFHAQPIACPVCGPHVRLEGESGDGPRDADAIADVARRLRTGEIVAIKGIGGYHLACDARNGAAVESLRERKFRKERPFAVMARDLAALRAIVRLSVAAEALALSPARPIVLGDAQRSALAGVDASTDRERPQPCDELTGVAPDNASLGVMLPYTPLHYLLFDAGAPDVLVMTSGNRSSEPIAYDDEDARVRLGGIADVRLVGERPIARRVDDSVVQDTVFGPVVVRRSRGYAPAVVAQLPAARPILAVGADLKNSVTLVVDGAAIASQHIGDLEHYESLTAFDRTVADLLGVYGVASPDLIVAYDAHPEYASTARAAALDAARRVPVQHHRAHIASAIAERGAFETRVVGVAFDGTGYGDDGAIWGGELLVGSVAEGFARMGHLREARLPGGDAAARLPPQAAAGFVEEIGVTADLTAPPFGFPVEYESARRMMIAGVRTFQTTSIGRLFDAVAALLGFTRRVTFEGQAAMWLEHLARASGSQRAIAFDVARSESVELDYRPAVAAIVEARRRGDDVRDIARGFHRGLAQAVGESVRRLADTHGVSTVVLSGGVFQNTLLLAELQDVFARDPFTVWTNREVPPNDGGISLGQAALAAFSGSQRTPRV